MCKWSSWCYCLSHNVYIESSSWKGTVSLSCIGIASWKSCGTLALRKDGLTYKQTYPKICNCLIHCIASFARRSWQDLHLHWFYCRKTRFSSLIRKFTIHFPNYFHLIRHISFVDGILVDRNEPCTRLLRENWKTWRKPILTWENPKLRIKPETQEPAAIHRSLKWKEFLSFFFM